MTGAGGAPSVAARKVPKEPGALSPALGVGVAGSSGSMKGTASSSLKDSILAWLPEGAAGAGGTLYDPVVSTTVGLISPACMRSQKAFMGLTGNSMLWQSSPMLSLRELVTGLLSYSGLSSQILTFLTQVFSYK